MANFHIQDNKNQNPGRGNPPFFKSNQMNFNFNLTLRKTQKKNGAFLYEIINPDGVVLRTRVSRREFVAATMTGMFFFTSLDQVGKGEHGDLIRRREVFGASNEMFKSIAIIK